MRITALSLPRVEIWPQKGLIRTLDTMSVATDLGLRLYAPALMFSDGASVPAPLWGVLSCSPIQALGFGLPHDAAYRIDARWTLPDASTRPIERHEADDLARALALWSGCSALDAAKIRWGLGVGAASSWQKKRLDWTP